MPRTVFFSRMAALLGFALLTTDSPQRATAAAASDASPLRAKWIWQAGAEVHAYNAAVIARRTVRLPAARVATLRITADSFYRLHINGTWVADGPARSWPTHFQYDALDVTPWLRDGENEIRILAIHYGVGDFHRIPQQAGLLAQLDLITTNGQTRTFGTDRSWQVAAFPALATNTPKISIQMPPAELYDARRESNLRFRPAAELFPAHAGPWQNLNPRDVALLNRQPFAFKAVRAARVVRADGWNFCVPATRLNHPGLIEANHHTSGGFGMATVLNVEQPATLRLRQEGMKMAVNGVRVDREMRLEPGRHLLVAFARQMFSHQKERAVQFTEPDGFTLVNPLDPGAENPWVFIALPEFTVATNDLVWHTFRERDPQWGGLARRHDAQTDAWLTELTNAAALRPVLGDRLRQLPADRLFVEDPFWQFTRRRVVGDASALVRNPSALLHDNAESTTILPSPDGDVELLLDLGEQNCGYWQFDLTADAGVQVDLFGVEHIQPDGVIQFPWGNRNGLRYVTRAGRNEFTSLKRRSGRYVFLTLRQQRTPVHIRHVQLVESTYPVEYRGSFACSDARLDRIWDISARTLKLCMEDTFTDCPLYEQTHWVGDARNEALFAFGVFGAHDLARRCIRLSAQSLERFPIVGAQTPSSWDMLIPAWSFLWGISTWDYYRETGDAGWLRSTFPDVIRNLRGAETLVNEQNLFSGPFWNFFDWVRLDDRHQTVLHNSLLLVGAIDAAQRGAEVLGATSELVWLRQFRARLTEGINRLWDARRNAFPDAVRDDGTLSPTRSQHTSILGLLYDVIPPDRQAAALTNLLAPPEDMVRVGSPFAALYLYEALEKFGREDLILEAIYQHYLPMLEAGATTVWESFPTGTTGGGRFPTRSHCHAWSSAPCLYLNRLVLGIRPTSPGAATVEISPRLRDLTWARGATATVNGPIEVSWRRDGNRLTVNYQTPPGVTARFVRNATHNGLTIEVNGKPWTPVPANE